MQRRSPALQLQRAGARFSSRHSRGAQALFRGASYAPENMRRDPAKGERINRSLCSGALPAALFFPFLPTVLYLLGIFPNFFFLFGSPPFCLLRFFIRFLNAIRCDHVDRSLCGCARADYTQRETRDTAQVEVRYGYSSSVDLGASMGVFYHCEEVLVSLVLLLFFFCVLFQVQGHEDSRWVYDARD